VPRIAHAGGGFKGRAYTNSIDALNHNADLFELFEIDLSITSDREVVCLHDWERSFKRSFGLEPRGPVSLGEFIDLTRKHSKFEKCTLDSLVAWLHEHETARVVTDVKSGNLVALEIIAARYPRMLGRFIPQIYSPEEYPLVRSLGYDWIIWTLYKYPGGNEKVLAEVRKMDLFAVTMPEERAKSGLARKLDGTGVPTYVHTINDREDLQRVRDLGVDEIYTDRLAPESTNRMGEISQPR
jgi:glycerophosphoryl diester phosphodiesterase